MRSPALQPAVGIHHRRFALRSSPPENHHRPGKPPFLLLLLLPPPPAAHSDLRRRSKLLENSRLLSEDPLSIVATLTRVRSLHPSSVLYSTVPSGARLIYTTSTIASATSSPPPSPLHPFPHCETSSRYFLDFGTAGRGRVNEFCLSCALLFISANLPPLATIAPFTTSLYRLFFRIRISVGRCTTLNSHFLHLLLLSDGS